MSSETSRVRFNPFAVTNHIANAFTQVPTSEPQLYRDDDQPEHVHPNAYDGDVESPDSFIHSQPFPSQPCPKRQRVRHKSEASPRRATQSDSAMAQPAPEKERRKRNTSGTSEKQIIRHTHRRRISGLSYQNADVCAQFQVMCAVISFIIELMLIIHFNLPNHFVGLGFIAGFLYFLAGAFGLTSAHSKQYRCTVICMVISALSVIMALYVAVGALSGLLALNQTMVVPELRPSPVFEDEFIPPEYDVGIRPNGEADLDYIPTDHIDYPAGPHEPYDVGANPMTSSESADITINQILYVIMIIISAIEMIFALAQAVICCSATCCKKYCFRRNVRAVTVIYTSCPEKKETEELVRKDVLERGDSSELQDSSYHSDDECQIDIGCDEVYVIPGVHLDDKATEDNHRAMEEYEVDEKGKKKKRKKKKKDYT